MFFIKISQALCLLGFAFVAIVEAQQIAPPPPGVVTPSGNWPPLIGEPAYDLNTEYGRERFRAYQQKQFQKNQAALNNQIFQQQLYLNNLDTYLRKLEVIYGQAQGNEAWEKSWSYLTAGQAKRIFIGPLQAENGNWLGQDNDRDNVPEPIFVAGYWNGGIWQKSRYVPLPQFDPRWKDKVDDHQYFRAQVIRVKDGDTVVVETTTGEKDVRLSGIDAPEMKQPGGEDAKIILSELLTGKDLKIKDNGKDKYGRTLGTIYVDNNGDGQLIDVNKTMVEKGMAWHYKRYDDSPILDKAEENARWERIGIWKNANPVQPWHFRRRNK